jgi:lantibiotic modifying enzyme
MADINQLVSKRCSRDINKIKESQQNLVTDLLDKKLRDAALVFCHDVAVACCVAQDSTNDHGDLADGQIGPALFLSAWHRFCRDEVALSASRFLAEACLGQLASKPMSLKWIDGITGTTWALRRVLAQPDDSEIVDHDFSAAVDQALVHQLGAKEWHGHYDLISGLVGYGLYALEHPDHDWRERLASKVLHHLEALAQHSSTGITWLTRPEQLSETDRIAYPNGNHNLGLAHGVPGVIGFLARCVEMNCYRKVAAALLVGAMDWMIAQNMRQAGKADSTAREGFFGYVAGSDHPVRLAWCYCDLGICVVLLRAANALARDDWRSFALEVARENASRRNETHGVIDMGLCHGSAGAALIFLRLWQQSGEVTFADACHFWLEKTLEMRRTDFNRTAGVYRADWKDGCRQYVGCIGYLTGAAGVGLAVLSCITGNVDAWDSPLLTDIPAVLIKSQETIL